MGNKCYACSLSCVRFFETPGGFPLYDQGFCGSLAGKESACNAGDPGSIILVFFNLLTIANILVHL